MRLNSNKYSIALLAASLLLCTGCKKDRSCDTPIGDATFTIDLRMPSATALNDIGGYIYVFGGNKGVCVTHPSANEYNAFERTCPNDHDTPVEMDEQSGGMVLRCPKCGDRFLTTDGAPLDGNTSSCNLYQYSSELDGYLIHVW